MVTQPWQMMCIEGESTQYGKSTIFSFFKVDINEGFHDTDGMFNTLFVPYGNENCPLS